MDIIFRGVEFSAKEIFLLLLLVFIYKFALFLNFFEVTKADDLDIAKCLTGKDQPGSVDVFLVDVGLQNLIVSLVGEIEFNRGLDGNGTVLLYALLTYL